MAIKKGEKLETILNAKAATGVGTSIDVRDYKHIVVEVWFAAATATIKFQGSISQDEPAFASAQAIGNVWDYIQAVDLQDGSAINGDTGVSSAGAASDARLFEINTNGLKWLNISVTARSAGAITAKVRKFTNS